MHMAEASITGTLRIIGILLLVWFALRWIAGRRAQDVRGQHRARPRARAKGEVRIERVPRAAADERADAPVIIDADYEEVK
jgi:hypothetical protein